MLRASSSGCDPFPNLGKPAAGTRSNTLLNCVSELGGEPMKRRTFLVGIGTAVIWPRAVGAQQADRARKIGVLLNFRRDDPEGQAQFSGFTQTLQKLGWTE